MGRTDDTVWFEFVESKVFSKQIGVLPAEVLINIQSELVQNPQRGDIGKGTHGVRKARAADPGSSRRKSGSYRYLYLYLEHARQNSFAVSIHSAKVTKPTYHWIKRASLAL